MSEVILDMAMSLDGFSMDHGGKSLFPSEQLRGTPILEKMISATGAVIMDRQAYESVGDDFTNFEYQTPLYILSDERPERVAKGEHGNLKFHFVTDGILNAIKLAKTAAHGKNVTIVGGTKAAQLAIEAGVVDIIKIRLIHLIVGQGIRLFEHLGDQHIKLEPVYTEEFKNRTDLCFKLARYKYISEPTELPQNAPLMPGWLNKGSEGFADRGPLLNR